ncbi:MAG: kinase/pyrophosphorylase, partial [Gammaproteobacteria bacterium]|nr:kinase/pyrophosphorylase [Gammaproteobacteria bacterium]
MKRTAFFISDSTGITAEVMGESLLSHFPGIEFDKQVLPYVDSEAKANEAVATINLAAERDGNRPIIFETLISKNLRRIITSANGFSFDVINTFLKPLEQELGAHSTSDVGRPRVASKDTNYIRRIEAINFALDNDDGARLNRYPQADIILTGVSRSGKTPTSLYLALQFGIYPANYPITEEDMEVFDLPKPLRDYRNKLFGLTISPERLTAIRKERRANSRYASVDQCRREVAEVER